MKRLLLLITGLLLLFSVEGQILRYSNYTAPTPPDEEEPAAGEYLRNGTFATNSYWTFGTSWSFNSQTAAFNDGASGLLSQSNASMLQEIAVTSEYMFIMDMSITGEGAYGTITLRNSANTVSYSVATQLADGTDTIYFYTISDIDGGGFGLYASDASTAAFTVDNLSLTETPNSISNGTFDSGDDWEFATANWTIGSGVASYDDGASSYIYQTAGNMVYPVKPSTLYRIRFDVNIAAEQTAAIQISNAAYNVQYYPQNTYADGSYMIEFTTPADIGDGGICFRSSASSTTAAYTLDNVTLTRMQ